MYVFDHSPLSEVTTYFCGKRKFSVVPLGGSMVAPGVKCRREGKEVFYMLDDEHVKAVFEVGVEHIEHKK